MDKQNEKQLVTAGIVVGGGYLLLKYGGKAIKDFFASLIPGAEDKGLETKIDTESTRTGSPWSPKFYDNAPNGALNITDYYLNIFINKIFGAISPIWDDFDAIYGVFKQLSTQSQVSYLSKAWIKATGYDLLTWLKGTSWPADRLSAEQVQVLMDYVSKLPKYNR